jgi:hypothetical protein
LTEAYRRVAHELDAILAPVGIAWENAKNLNPGLVLHHKDGRHANPIGAYLTACVFYSTLTGTSPGGLPESFFIEGKSRPDQGQDQALLLQKVAWEVGNRNSECGSGKREMGSRNAEVGKNRTEG